MKTRILLVDDLESNLTLIKAYVRDLDVKIDSCLIPKKAKTLALKYQYSLILLDVQMPDINGFVLADFIRTTPLNKSTPIIFLTGVFYDDASISKGYETGAIDFLTKPISKKILISKIKVFIEMFNQKKELQRKSELLEEYIQRLKNAEKQQLRYLIEGEDKERERISRELHDSVGQYLSAVSLNFTAIRNDIINNECSIADRFDVGMELLHKAIEESRSLTRCLIPKSVADYGLNGSVISLVKSLEKSTGLKIVYLSNLQEKRLNRKIETNLYRISQECLNNAIKHSKATEIVLQIYLHEKVLSLTYEDNGVGFEISENDSKLDSYGLQIMKNRAKFMNASLEIESTKGSGTNISVEIPIENVLI
jgi:signal transduction histidine kinase